MSLNQESPGQRLIGVTTRKKRLTKQEIEDFARWALTNNVFETYTCGMIKQMYEEETGVVLTESTVRKQKNRWVLIDDVLYDLTKPHLLPKKEEEENAKERDEE